MSKVGDTFVGRQCLLKLLVYTSLYILILSNAQIRIALSKSCVLYDILNFSLEAHLC